LLEFVDRRPAEIAVEIVSSVAMLGALPEPTTGLLPMASLAHAVHDLLIDWNSLVDEKIAVLPCNPHRYPCILEQGHMRFSQACTGQQRLRNATLLAYLSSSIDRDRVIVVATGEVLNVSTPPPTYLSVVDELTATHPGGSPVVTYDALDNIPIKNGTLTGTIYDGGVAIQTFEADLNGGFSFIDVGSPSPKCTNGSINLETGALTLLWIADPGETFCQVSYQYATYPSLTSWRKSVEKNVNNDVWMYYEEQQPKRMLLTSKSWYINSFDPMTRAVCVTIDSGKGIRTLSFVLNPIVYQ